jgi:hypothetical protein
VFSPKCKQTFPSRGDDSDDPDHRQSISARVTSNTTDCNTQRPAFRPRSLSIMPVARRTIARTARESVPLPDDLVNYLALIPPIFGQVQHNASNHRKNVVSLRKIQEKCAEITEQGPKGTMLVGEKGFNTKFMECLERVLPVKKGVAVADRVVAFVGKFVNYTTEQGEEQSIRRIRQVTDPLLYLMRRRDQSRREWRRRRSFLPFHDQAHQIPPLRINRQRQVRAISNRPDALCPAEQPRRDR